MSINLDTIKFTAVTDDLDKALTKIDALAASAEKLSKAFGKDISIKVNSEDLGNATTATAKLAVNLGELQSKKTSFKLAVETTALKTSLTLINGLANAVDRLTSTEAVLRLNISDTAIAKLEAAKNAVDNIKNYFKEGAQIKVGLDVTAIRDSANAIDELAKKLKSLKDASTGLDKLALALTKEQAVQAIQAEKLGLAAAKRQEAEDRAAIAAQNRATVEGKAVKQVSDEVAKATTILERQEAIRQFMTEGFTKGQSSILAYAKAAGLAAEEIGNIGDVLKSQRKLIGGDPFDKSLSAIEAMKNELGLMKQAESEYSTQSGLTLRQLKDLGQERVRVTEKMQLEGKTEKEIAVALKATTQEYTKLAKEVNTLKSSIETQDIAAKNSVNAVNRIGAAWEKLNNQLADFNKNMGTGNLNALKRFRDDLIATKKPLGEQIAEMVAYRIQLEKVQGLNSQKAVDHLARAVAPQITDIFVGMATGQSPLTILLQQGGQLRDQFGMFNVEASRMPEVLKNSMTQMAKSIKDVGAAVGSLVVNGFMKMGQAATNAVQTSIVAFTDFGYGVLFGQQALEDFKAGLNGGLSPIAKMTQWMRSSAVASFLMGGAIVALVAGLGLFAYSAYKSMKQNEELNKSLNLTGASLGMNVHSAHAAVQAFEALGGSGNVAMSTLTAMAKEGGFTSSSFLTIAKAAQALEKSAGIAVEETVKNFKKLATEPSKGLAELASQLGTIPPKILEQVASLERQGKTFEAIDLAQKEYAKGAEAAANDIKANYGTLEEFSHEVSTWFDKMWDSVLGIGRPVGKNLETQITELSAKINSGNLSDEEGIALTYELIRLKRQLYQEQEKSKNTLSAEDQSILNPLLQKAQDKSTTEARKKMSLSEFQDSRFKEDTRKMKMPESISSESTAILFESYKKEFEDLQNKINSQIPGIKLPVDNSAVLKSDFDEKFKVIERALKVSLALENKYKEFGLKDSEESNKRVNAAAKTALDEKIRLLEDYQKKELTELARQEKVVKSQGSSKGKDKALDEIANKVAKFNNEIKDQKNLAESDFLKPYQDRIISMQTSLKAFGDEIKKVELSENSLAKQRASALETTIKTIGMSDREIVGYKAMQEEKARLVSEEDKLIQKQLEASDAVKKASDAYATASVTLGTTHDEIVILKEALENAKKSGVGLTEALEALKGKMQKSPDDVKADALFAFDKGKLAEFTKTTKGLDIGETLAKGWNRFSSALGDVAQRFLQMSQAAESFNNVQSKLAKDSPEYKKNIEDYKNAQLGAYMNMAGAAKSYFGEKTDLGKAANVVEKALMAEQISIALSAMATKMGAESSFTLFSLAQSGLRSAALGIEAILGQLASNPGPAAFAAGAAMAAVVVGLGVAIKGALSGGSRSDVKINKGTGTVLGDKNAESKSVSNLISDLKEIEYGTSKTSSKMLTALMAIQDNTAGLATFLVQSGAISTGLSGIKTGYRSNDIAGAISGALRTGVAVVTAGLSEFLGFGDAFGKMVGGLFGTKTSVTGQGIQAGQQGLSSILSGGFQGQSWATIEKRNKTLGITTSTDRSTVINDLAQEAEDSITKVIVSIVDSIKLASKPLGINLQTVVDRINSAVVSIDRIDLNGLTGEDQQKRLDAVFSKLGDDLTKQIIPGFESFQKVNEGYYQTVLRVSSGVDTAENVLDKLGIGMIKYTDLANKQGDVTLNLVRESLLAKEGVSGVADILSDLTGSAQDIADAYKSLTEVRAALQFIGVNGNAVTESLVRGAGGISSLEEAMSAFQDSFLTEAERTSLQTSKMRKSFEALGLAMPTTAQGFKDLVAGMPTGTDEADKLLGKLLGLSDGFSQIVSSVDDASQAFKDFSDSIKEYVSNLGLDQGNVSTNFDAAKATFAAQLKLAKTGDTTAMDSLTNYADKLLELAAANAGSSLEYERILSSVKNELMSVIGASTGGTSLSDIQTQTASVSPTAQIATYTEQSSTMLGKILDKLEAMRVEDRAEGSSVATNIADIAKVIKRVDNGDSLRTVAV
jgi:phage-related minor tail protein